jgi:hypothetical protein
MRSLGQGAAEIGQPPLSWQILKKRFRFNDQEDGIQ